jgi:hypothetical protein
MRSSAETQDKVVVISTMILSDCQAKVSPSDKTFHGKSLMVRDICGMPWAGVLTAAQGVWSSPGIESSIGQRLYGSIAVS